MKRALIVLGALFALFSVSPVFAAIDVPIIVQEALYAGDPTGGPATGGITRVDEPFCQGIPIPDSANITGTNVLGLSGATAAQFRILSSWPSGNAKWIKVCGMVPSVPAGGTTTVTLTDSGSGNFGGPNLATDGATISIATGAATFTVNKANFNFIDTAVVAGATIVSSSASAERGLVVMGPSTTAVFPDNVTCGTGTGQSPCTKLYSSANDPTSTCVIEENGPMMAILKCTGRHVDGAGNAYMHFTLRETFYKNKSYIRVRNILRNADYAATNSFATAVKGMASYDLRINPGVSGTLNYKIAADPTQCLGACAGTLAGSASAYIYQGQSNLMKGEPWGYPTADVGYTVVGNGTTQATGDANHYPTGWADISDAAGKGIEIGINQMAAYFPKSLEFANGGTDVRIGIWASENGNPVGGIDHGTRATYQAWQEYGIDDLYVNLHATALTSTAAANAFLSFQHPLLGRADYTWYNAAGVFPFKLLDPAVEDNFYANQPQQLNPPYGGGTYKAHDLSVGGTTLPIVAYRYRYPGNPATQTEFRWSQLLNFIRRGYSGGYLDSAQFYKWVVEKSLPRLDGGDMWKNHMGGIQDVDSRSFPRLFVPQNYSQLGYTGCTSPSCSFDFSDMEHRHIYGVIDYYLMTGDETVKDWILGSLIDYYTNNSGTPGNINNATLAIAGGYINDRSIGNHLMIAARLYTFLNSIGDTANANLVSSVAQTVYNDQVRPDLCTNGYPGGCVPDGNDHTTLNASGISRVRGMLYGTYKNVATPEGDGSYPQNCGNPPPSPLWKAGFGSRIATGFKQAIALAGMWEWRKAIGPSWQYYTESFDLMYGISQWALNEDYADDGTGSWKTSGQRYYLQLDGPSNIPVGCSAVNHALDYFLPSARVNTWMHYFIQTQYNGSVSAWKSKAVTQLSLNYVNGLQIDNGVYTQNLVIDAMANPPSLALQTATINSASFSGGNYSVNINVPSGATTYRAKCSTNSALAIVEWIGFDAGNFVWTNPARTPANSQNWFAATEITGLPTASGTTQTLTIPASACSGQTNLTAKNFMVKAWTASSGGGSGPPPSVSMTSPANGSTVSGTVAMIANASSSLGLAGVQFRIDGTDFGGLVIGGGPYTISWDTTTAANGSHTLAAIATDLNANNAVSAISVTVSNTTVAPVISNLMATSISASGASITWTTNTPSDTQVSYGTTSGYGSITGLASALLTTHSVILSGLTPSTTYHFRAQSKDAQGNLGMSVDLTFTTSASQSGGSLPLKDWVMVPTAGVAPQVVGWEKLAYSPASKKALIFGNYHEVGSEPNRGMLAYDFASNRWDVMDVGGLFHTENMPEGGHPVGVFDYDPVRNVFITYCCESGSMQPETVFHTWWFDPLGQVGLDKFTSPKPGLNPQEASASYDSFNHKFIMMGSGFGTWSYDSASDAWQALTPNKVVQGGGTFPSYFDQLGMHSMAYNSSNHKIYLFGGRLNYGPGEVFYNDIYTYDVPTNTWTLLKPVGPRPSVRQKCGFAYDSTNNVFLMFGGDNDTGLGSAAPPVLNDTWAYDPVANTWTQLNPAQTPKPNFGVFERLMYDPDDNVFVLLVDGTGGYQGGVGTGFAFQTWFFRYQGSGPSPGTITPAYQPSAGSINRKVTGWANEPAIASSGTNLYAAWVETGGPFDGGNSTWPHIYVDQQVGGAWSMLGSSYTSVNPEAGGTGEWYAPSVAYAGGVPWVAYYGFQPTLGKTFYAKSWNGSSWQGGVVSTVASQAYIGRSQLLDVGGVPHIAYIETDRSANPSKAFVYVRFWNGSQWVLKGTGPLNQSSGYTFADSVSIASDGSNPYVAWTEYTSNVSTTSQTNPQVYVSRWTGSQWVAVGGALNTSTNTGWAFDASIAFLSGQPYVAWTERTQSGNAQLFVATFTGSNWALTGSGTLNKDTNTGWAFRPSLVSDGAALYVGWIEQQALGQRPQGYVAKYTGGAWAPLGGSLNADTALGSAQRISLALVGGQPVAAWGEVNFGSTRQVFVKQWNGSQWSLLPGTSSGSPGATCDLNTDGLVTVTDVQIAVNQVLGTLACTTADLQQNGTCNVVDVQRVINAALGAPCKIGP